MNTIQLNKIHVEKNLVTYGYELAGEWSFYFNTECNMKIEYSVDIAAVPKSVLAVPFVSNILPIIWLCDATLYIEEMDKDFYNNLDSIKKGYMDMYPMLLFEGQIEVGKIVENKVSNQNVSAVFFSGGVDAYTTLLRHIDEKPYLVTLWGADVKLNDAEGWKNVENHINTVSKEYGLKNVVVKSNFRNVIKEGELTRLVKASGDGWWHGFQHGVAIISHMAPLAYSLGIRQAYIAASFPEKMKGQYTCASDPSIDNYVRYCGCKTIHDAYEWDRQEKVQYLVKMKELENPIQLRVCWISTNGKNCCSCEKCYRTILEIVSEAGNPNEYGFEWDERSIIKCKKDMLHKITLQEYNIDQFYYPIRDNMFKNKDKIENYEQYRWFTKLDYTKFNNYPMKVLRKSVVAKIFGKVVRLIRKV